MEGIRCEFQQKRTLAQQSPCETSMLDYARQKGWSSDGEMFHAVNLARLAGSPPCGLSSAVFIELTQSALADVVARQGIPVLIS